jgi:hypothetical protein
VVREGGGERRVATPEPDSDPSGVTTSLPLCPARAIQLTSRSRSDPERNPFMNWRRELTGLEEARISAGFGCSSSV